MNLTIDVANILSSQNDLRNVWQIRQMVDYVEAGGYFTRGELVRYAAMTGGRGNPPLIALTEFPDGTIMAHDGHHRLTSIYLAGRRILMNDEYIVKKFTYPDYTEINLAAGWVTPFDPLTEIRLCEFGPFKREVSKILAESHERAEEYIRNNGHLYSAPRDIHFIPELAARVAGRLACDQSARHGSGYCLTERW